MENVYITSCILRQTGKNPRIYCLHSRISAQGDGAMKKWKKNWQGKKDISGVPKCNYTSLAHNSKAKVSFINQDFMTKKG